MKALLTRWRRLCCSSGSPAFQMSLKCAHVDEGVLMVQDVRTHETYGVAWCACHLFQYHPLQQILGSFNMNRAAHLRGEASLPNTA